MRGGLADKEGKTNVLMQAYIIRAPLKAFALVSDTMFIAQSASRLARGLPLPLTLTLTSCLPLTLPLTLTLNLTRTLPLSRRAASSR